MGFRMSAPTTLREKLMNDREMLYNARSSLYNAILELAGGAAVASYSLGNRSVTKTRASLGDMQKSLRFIDNQIFEIEAMLNGRPVRNTSTWTYQSPQILVPPFFF